MMPKVFILLLILTFSLCTLVPKKEEPEPENPYRAAMLKKLREKIECDGCNPTKEELVEYYLLKNEPEFQGRRTSRSSANPWQNYFRTYFLYFPNNLKNPWYTPGSGSANGGRAPGMYYPYGGIYGRGQQGNYGAGRRY